MGKQLALAEEAQAAARDAHTAADHALRQEIDHRVSTVVVTAQNEALAKHKQALGQLQDQYAIQCSQAERKCNDALAMVATLTAQLSQQRELLPRVAQAEHDQVLQQVRREAHQTMEAERASALRAHQEAQYTIEAQRTVNEQLRRQAEADRATAAATAAAAAQREDLLRAELQRAQHSAQHSAVSSERSRVLQSENDNLRGQLQASGKGTTAAARPPQPPPVPTQRFSITSDAGSNIGPSASAVGTNAAPSEQR